LKCTPPPEIRPVGGCRQPSSVPDSAYRLVCPHSRRQRTTRRAVLCPPPPRLPAHGQQKLVRRWLLRRAALAAPALAAPALAAPALAAPPLAAPALAAPALSAPALAAPALAALVLAAPALAAPALAAPAVWAEEEEDSTIGLYGCTKPTTTVAVGGLRSSWPASRLPVLSSKAWPSGSISSL
jgi:hypothetical protein